LLLFKKKSTDRDYRSRAPKAIEIINRALDNLAMTTDIRVNQMCATVVNPPSATLHHRSRAQLVIVKFVIVDRRDCHDKVMMDPHIIAAAVVNAVNRRLEEIHLERQQ
jgi:hypothetical protein